MAAGQGCDHGGGVYVDSWSALCVVYWTDHEHETGTNAFSKKVEFHAYAVSLFYMCYNFVKVHQSLRIKNAGGAYT